MHIYALQSTTHLQYVTYNKLYQQTALAYVDYNYITGTIENYKNNRKLTLLAARYLENRKLYITLLFIQNTFLFLIGENHKHNSP